MRALMVMIITSMIIITIMIIIIIMIMIMGSDTEFGDAWEKMNTMGGWCY